LVDSVAFALTVRAVALAVSRVDLTVSWVVGCCAVLDWCAVLDFFFFFGFGSAAAVFVSLESVDASAFSSAGCLASDVDVPEVASDDDTEPDVLEGWADATPCPTKTAAPIPRATASPPIRPT
jgi:hypothetical protein